MVKGAKKRSAGIKLIVYPAYEALACLPTEDKQCRAHAVTIYKKCIYHTNRRRLCLTVRLDLNLRDSYAADKTPFQRLFCYVLSPTRLPDKGFG